MRMITCPECQRKFDIYNSELDAEEFFYGHDCEETEPQPERKES